MKTLLSALAVGAALTLTGAGVSTADAAPAKKAPVAQETSQATDFSAQRRHWHGHRHGHWRGGPRYGYGPRYYAPRPAYGYGYGRPYGGYGYGGPVISFGFGGGRW